MGTPVNSIYVIERNIEKLFCAIFSISNGNNTVNTSILNVLLLNVDLYSRFF